MTRMFEDLQAGLAEVDAFLAGQRSGYKVTVPTEIDVKSIRKALHMTQARFSDAFGFSLDAVKHWEGGHPPQGKGISATHSRVTSAQRQPKRVAKSPQPVTVHS